MVSTSSGRDRNRDGLVTKIDGNNLTAGMLARRVLLTAVLAPPASGLLAYGAYRLGWVGYVGTAYMAAAVAFVALLSVTLRSARRLEAVDRVCKDSERFVNLILESMPVGVCVLDPAGAPVRVNAALGKIWGSAKVLPREKWNQLRGWWLHNGRPLAMEDWAAVRVLDGQEEVAEDLVELETADGRRRVISNTAIAVRDPEGRMTATLVVNRDQTRQFRLEQQHSLMARIGLELMQPMDVTVLLQKVADLTVPSIADGCFVAFKTEQDGALEWVAQSTVPGEHRIGIERLMRDYKPNPSRLSMVLEHGRSLLTSQVTDLALVGLAQDEAHARLIKQTIKSYVVVPIRSARGILGLMTLVFSESDRRYDHDLLYTAEEIGRAAGMAVENAIVRKNLQTAICAREEVCAIVSHDLRNPLSAIHSGSKRALELMAEPQTNQSDVIALTQMVHSASERMLNLVGDLLDLSRMEAGALQIAWSRLCAADILRTTAQIFSSQAEQKNIRIEIKAESDLPMLCGDSNRVFQVLSNLIGNALKYTPKGGIVTLKAEKSNRGEWIEFSVIDSGPGIDEKYIPHIFERYWQPRESVQKGAGLGLFIAKWIVEAHGGEIRAHSEAGCGSSFVFTMPTVVHPVARAHLARIEHERGLQAAPV